MITCISEQKSSREIKRTSCRAQKQDCVEAYICCIESPYEQKERVIGGNQTPLMTCTIPSQQWSNMVVAWCGWGVFGMDWGTGQGSSTFQKDIHKAHSQDNARWLTAGTSLWLSLSGSARAPTWTQSNISGKIWQWLSANSPHPIWQSLRWSAEKNDRKSPNPGVLVVPK